MSSINGFSEPESVNVQIRGLCEEVKSGRCSPGYIHLRLKEILCTTRWSYLLKPLQLNVISPERLVKYVYDAWLSINGLKIDNKRG